jgi:Ca-activated chloride channel family protein
MRFAAPEFLWLLLLVPLGVLAGMALRARSARALARFAGGEPYVARFTAERSQNRRAVKAILVATAIAALALALARPQWGASVEEVTRAGGDVVVVLDTSLSMAAEDVAPSRIELAKHAIGSLLGWLEGDRVALVTFAGQAQLDCPLTVDHGAVRLFLEAADPAAAAVGGSAVADGLARALRALGPATAGPAGDGAEIDEVLAEVRQAGVPVHAVGTGTARGAPIPLRDAAGMLAAYKKDAADKVVTTRLDEALLERIALETGGRYVRASAGELELEQVGAALAGLKPGEIGTSLRVRYEERFIAPLLVAWLLLALEAVLGDRRAGAAGRRRREAA